LKGSKKPEVSVIIVNYNTEEYLKKCLDSIPKEYEVIVIDNSSTDQSLELAVKKYPEFTYYKFSRNQGFAKACNTGTYLSQGKYILFLNPDSLLEKKGVKRCIEVLRRKKEVGAVTGKVVYPSGVLQPNVRKEKGFLNFLFGRTSFLRKIFPNTSLEKEYFYQEKELKKERDVELTAAMALMVKRKAFESIKGFDERFFLYWEDFDLSIRLRENGWRIHFVPEVVSVHHLGKSAEKNKKFAKMHKLKGFYNFIKKHKKLKKFALLTLFFFISIRILLLLSFK